MPPEDKIELYDKAVATARLERNGKTNPYTSTNGYMYSHLGKDGVMGLRLPVEDQSKFLQDHESGPYMQHGSVMKDYVKIPDDVLRDTKKIATYLKTSHAYTNTLKPKK